MDLLHILSIASRVVLVILLVGLVIFIHELGHFLAARRLGMVVDVFSLGFGPALWKRKIGGVEYRLSLIPLGGYVAIPQLDPSGMETVQGDTRPKDGDKGKDSEAPRELPPAAPWKRIVVAIAGPFGNVVLAVVMAWWIYLSPGAVTGGASTQIGSVKTNSPAWKAGLRPGQVIASVNGKSVTNWVDFIIECHLIGDPKLGVTLALNDGVRVQDVRVPLAVATDDVMRLSFVAGVEPKGACVIRDVTPGSAAREGGMQVGDRLLRVNATDVVSSGQFMEYMKANGTNAVRIEVVREGRPLVFSLLPRMNEELGKAVIGVAPGDPLLDIPPWMLHRQPWKQIQSDATQVVRVLQALVFPRHKGEAGRAADSVGGPPSIIRVLWDSIKTGLLNTLGLLRMIGINLAIINLLPIPVLDGGHVMFALLEIVTRRRPNPKVMAVVVNFFAILIIGLMLLLIVHDPVTRAGMAKLWPRKPAAAARAAVAPAALAGTNAQPAAATHAPPGEAAP